MTFQVPPLHQLRAQAAAQGIHATDDDLERVCGFLNVLYPQFEELERLVPPETVPAALSLPPDE
jgi:hypothetical protein